MITITNLKDIDNSDIFKRDYTESDVNDIVADIISNVRLNKDKALFEYTEKFDKAKLQTLEVSCDEIEHALSVVEDEFIKILEHSAQNIYNYHSKQLKNGYIINDTPGKVLGMKVLPLEKVGIYVPGGTASYPSSVLMNSIPAKIAGVGEIIMTTPAQKDGSINPYILAAAKIAGVDRIFKIGGAQAIAALAYGTESVPAVDKIVGPGNIFVATAKKQVFGKVSIDMVAGPSEILVIADKSFDPAIAAADLLSQAEHDKLATAVLITDSEEFALKVSYELERQIPLLPRAEIARVSIDTNGKILIAKSIKEAIEISNLIAPEHLEICVDNPFDYLDDIKHAGSVFLGKNCPEALGDYFAGTNHTLPTSGTARFSSPLGVDDFVKRMSFTYCTHEALEKDCKEIEYFAIKEGLDAHARSVMSRFKDNK